MKTNLDNIKRFIGTRCISYYASSKSVIDKLAEYGTLKDLPENDQIDLF